MEVMLIGMPVRLIRASDLREGDLVFMGGEWRKVADARREVDAVAGDVIAVKVMIGREPLRRVMRADHLELVARKDFS